MKNDHFLWLSPEQWAGASALGTILLVGITGSYAWLTRQAFHESRLSTDAAKESARASTKAAEAAVEATEALLRQADAMERAELVNAMPMVQCIANGVNNSVEPPQVAVKATNSGRGTAVNIALRALVGSSGGTSVRVKLALYPGTTSAQEENLQYPASVGGSQSPLLIEARYQNNQGREFASQTHSDGRVDYYLIRRDTQDGTPKYEELLKAPLAFPDEGRPR